MADWKGTSQSLFTTIGASNHTSARRQAEDYYATEPKAAELLCRLEMFNHDIWECACGERHLADVLTGQGYNVRCSDVVNRCGNEIMDFLSPDNKEWHGDIITNPPYKFALEFCKKALQIIPEGNKVAMFLKLTFLEGKARRELFEQCPPKVVYVSSQRLLCAKNGDFARMIAGGGSAVAYAWFVWEKGYKGETIVKWFN